MDGGKVFRHCIKNRSYMKNKVRCKCSCEKCSVAPGVSYKMLEWDERFHTHFQTQIFHTPFKLIVVT